MPGQGPDAYAAEHEGNLQVLLGAFVAHRRYINDSITAIEPFSTDDNFEGVHWCTRGAWALHETGARPSSTLPHLRLINICVCVRACWNPCPIEAHLFSFRVELFRSCKLAELDTVDIREVSERWAQWPLLHGAKAGGMHVSADGLVGDVHFICFLTLMDYTCAACTASHVACP